MHKREENKLLLLKEADFSDKEVAVYIALLEVGKGSVSDIAKMSKIDRTTTYRILQSFLTMPIAQVFKEDKKNRWTALSPRYLVEFVQKKKNVVQELLPELEALYNLNEEKPKLQYFEGREGLANLTANMIKEVKHRGEILSFSAPGAASGYYSTKEFDKLSRERADKQILSKIMIPSIEEIPGYRLGEDWKNWRHIKIVDPEKSLFKASLNIWNDKVAILTVRSHPIGVVIESKDVADTLKSIFNMLWEGAEKYQKNSNS